MSAIIKTLITRYQDVSGQWIIEKCVPWGPEGIILRRQLRLHYLVASGLEISGVARPFALRKQDAGLVLTLPWVPEVNLVEYASTRQGFDDRSGLPLADVYDIGRRLALILSQIAVHGLAHGALEASNVIIDPKSRQLTLLNFGFSRFTRTLSVDQGEREIDLCDDLHALGHLLYWLATGQRARGIKLEGADAIIAGWTPEILANLPNSFISILIRLLNAGTRQGYQCFAAVADDLMHCQQNEGNGALGSLGIPVELVIPRSKFGREDQIEALVKAYSNATQDVKLNDSQEQTRYAHPVFILVEGASGSGKTTIINDVCRSMSKYGARIAFGKFNQFGDSHPLWAIAQALDSIVEQILESSQLHKMLQIERIREATADLAQVLIDVIPRLEKLLGSQPTPPILPGEANRMRFELLMRRFIATLTSKEQPLVLVMDDMHWANQVSLNLLRNLLRDFDIRYFMIIGAFRSEAMKEGHPLLTAIAAITADSSDIRQISLHAWTCENIKCLLKAADIKDIQSDTDLASVLLSSTSGNPLWILQALREISDAGALHYQENKGYWWVDARIAQKLIGGVSIVELAQRQLRRLSATSQQIISTGAFLGTRFDLETLSAATSYTTESLPKLAWPALARGFLVMIEDHSVPADVITLRLAHDTVQQAIYNQVDTKIQAQYHAAIGRALYITYSASATLQTHLFEVLQHLNRISLESIHFEERKQLLELNISAGRKSRMSGSMAAALQHCNQALRLLDQDSWTQNPEHTYEVTRNAAEAAYLAADFDLLDSLLESLSTRPLSEVDNVRVQELCIQGLLARNRLAEALEIGEKSLTLLGIALEPLSDSAQWPRVPELSQLNLNHLSDARIDTALRVLVWLTPCAFITSFEMYTRVILTMIRLANQYPASPLTPISYTNYGLTLCGVGRNCEGYQAGELALALSEQVGDEPLRCKVWVLTYGFLQHWGRPVKYSLQPLLETVNACLLCGDQEYVGYASFLYCDKAWGLEKLGNLETIHTEHTCAVEHFGHEFSWRHCQVWLQFIQALRGDAFESLTLRGRVFDAQRDIACLEQANNRFSLFTAHMLQAFLAWHRGNFSEALQECRIAEEYASTAVATMLSIDHQMLSVICELHNYMELNEAERTEVDAHVEKMLTRLRSWAQISPENVNHKLTLAEAEFARCRGDSLSALKLYETSLEQVSENAFQHDLGLIAERAGNFYFHLGLNELAINRLYQAYESFMRWGALAVGENLLHRYPWLAKSTALQMNAIATRETGLSLRNKLAILLIELNLDRIILEVDDVTTTLIVDRQTDNTLNIKYLSSEVASASNLPIRLLQRVRQQSEFIEIYYPAEDPSWSDDAYLTLRCPMSIAAMPIFRAGRVMGTLYVESFGNRLLSSRLIGERLAYDSCCIVDEMRAEQLSLCLQETLTLDTQTGLLNRSAFIRTIDMQLAHMRSTHDSNLAVVVVHLRHFSHLDVECANEVFREITKHLTEKTKANGGLARIEHLNFALLYRGLDANLVLEDAKRIQQILNQPHRDEHGLNIETDIGICFDNGYFVGATLLEDAEAALASVSGRTLGSVVVYDPVLHRISPEKDIIVRDLRWAIKNNGLRLVYQPIVDINTLEIVALEALLRWRHPVKGEMLIEDIIFIAEEQGLIYEVGRWVIEAAITQTRKWHHDSPTTVNFNASPDELGDPNYASFVLAMLKQHDLPGTAIVIEITESTLIYDQEITQLNLHLLRNAGITLCIDDFGVGTSSLSRLHNSMAQRLKIDRSFIEGLPDSHARQATVQLIINLAKVLVLDIVAEGASTVEAVEYLRASGVRKIQGFYFSRPLELKEADLAVRRGRVIDPILLN